MLEKEALSPEFTRCFHLYENPSCPYIVPKKSFLSRRKQKVLNFLMSRKFKATFLLTVNDISRCWCLKRILCVSKAISDTISICFVKKPSHPQGISQVTLQCEKKSGPREEASESLMFLPHFVSHLWCIPSILIWADFKMYREQKLEYVVSHIAIRFISINLANKSCRQLGTERNRGKWIYITTRCSLCNIISLAESFNSVSP